MFLLDTSVLIALADPTHVHHQACNKWFQRARDQGWATCPIVELGFLRITSQRPYAPVPLPLKRVREVLLSIRSIPGHTFVPDDVTPADEALLPFDRISGPKQLTDAYLLALCRQHGLRLATLDKSIRAQQQTGEDLVELI